MKKIGIILMISINMLSFGIFDKIKSEIKLKEEETPRFKEIKVIVNGKEKMRKVIPGKYQINLFEINYPTDVFGKNRFYNDFNKVLENINKNKKYSLLLEKRFYDDMQKIKTDEMSEEEKVLELPASSLDGYGIQELSALSKDLNVSQYAGTDQEYLNRQIYVLYKLLGKKDFNSGNVYSELDKEFLISELKEKRKKIVKNFENSNFEYFVKESYDNIDFRKFQDDSVYKFDKDIVISEKIEDQALLPEIKNNLYLTDFPSEITEELAKNNLKLKREILLIENDRFHGYTYNENNTVVFVNGKNPEYYYNDYKIDVILKRTDILELLKTSSNYYVSDFFN
ncbi:MAG: hypothetical protein Q4D53_03115 [Leptotrichiaceae bacterium]|nr:hypothetical protein [Leptotrichiaceae bacterium]